jgi:hypothetical protein
MFKHKAQYQYRTESGISGIKEIEFELEKELDHDGAGAWKDTCINIITKKTGKKRYDILNNDNLRCYCVGKVNSNNSSQTSSKTSNSNDVSREKNVISNQSTSRSSNSGYSSSSQPSHSKVSYSVCDICGETYKNGDGYYNYIRDASTNKRSDYAKYHFCTMNCYESKFENGYFIVVGEDGLTDDEREEQEKASREYNREREKREKLERERDREIQIKKQREIDKKNVELKIIKAENDRKELRLITIIGIPILILALVFIFYKNNEITNQKNEAVKINLALEQIEDSIKLYINDRNYNRALFLTNQLVHPIHELFDGKGSVWEGEYYDLYWDKKREEYKNLVNNRGVIKKTSTVEENSNNDNATKDKSENKKPNVKEEEHIEKVPDVPEYDKELDKELDEEYKN